MGIDTDDVRAHGEVGHCGVAISSLADMERLFEDIPLDQVTTSRTINEPATVRTLFRPGTPMNEIVDFVTGLPA